MSNLLKDRYRVQAAINGEKALTIATSNTPPDIILLDVVMPGLDGYEVLQALRADPRCSQIPVIFLTARSDAEDEEKGLLLGAVDYLVKPISPAIAMARINTHLTLYRQRRALIEVQELISQELTEAAEYVRTLLPPPQSGDISSDWKHIPCTALGGDAFGHHWIDSDHLAIYLLDVCGHGIGAALLSISVINTLRSQSLGSVDFRRPAAVLAALNDGFPMEDHNNKYFTVWYGVYDRNGHELHFASAGHPPAVLLRSEPDQETDRRELTTKNPAIGYFSGRTFAEDKVSLLQENKLFVFSDGVYEFCCKDGRTMSAADFVSFLNDTGRVDAFDSDAILAKMNSLKSKPGPFDDDYSFLEIIISGGGRQTAHPKG
jgi:sigma-B regulation protein RsbU (phosphoserine phosphatase)